MSLAPSNGAMHFNDGGCSAAVIHCPTPSQELPAMQTLPLHQGSFAIYSTASYPSWPSGVPNHLSHLSDRSFVKEMQEWDLMSPSESQDPRASMLTTAYPLAVQSAGSGASNFS